MSAPYNTRADAERAVRRAERWLRSRRHAAGEARPGHIGVNMAKADRQLTAGDFPKVETTP